MFKFKTELSHQTAPIAVIECIRGPQTAAKPVFCAQQIGGQVPQTEVTNEAFHRAFRPSLYY